MTHRLCLVLDLIDDPEKIAAYEKHHAPGAVWPAVIEDIKAQGIEGMEIWIQKSDRNGAGRSEN